MKLLLALIPALLLAQVKVPFERIRDAHKEPGNWLSYSGNYNGHRHSLLDQVNASNVGNLKVAWVHQKQGESEPFETSAVIVDDVMFITEPPNIVKALSARTGRQLWTYRKEIPKDLRLCCGRVNRGVAVLNDAVYLFA